VQRRLAGVVFPMKKTPASRTRGYQGVSIPEEKNATGESWQFPGIVAMQQTWEMLIDSINAFSGSVTELFLPGTAAGR
jgi:hypothetical protein